MTKDEGLPLPPRPTPPKPSIPRAVGVPEGMVRDHFTLTSGILATRGERWRDEINRAQRESEFDLRGVTDSGPTALDRLQSRGELLAEGLIESKPLQALEAGLGLMSPISALTEAYQVAKIDAMQEQFIKDYGPVLKEMARHMGMVARRLQDLSDLADENKVKFRDPEIDRIMQEKRTKGDATMRRIDERLRAAKTPEEREKLQALKGDLTKWMTDRDARVAKDEVEVREIDIRGSVLAKELAYQASRMGKAAVMAQNAVGGINADPRLDYVIHTRPETALLAAGIRQHLLNSRADVEAIRQP